MAKLAVAFKTDTGSIPGKSEDAYLFDNNLFIVAEGIGGEYLDEIAKEMACRVIRDTFFRNLEERQSPSDALLDAMNEANRDIRREGKKMGQKMAASVSVVYVRDAIMYFTHLGDSRIYCLQKGEILQLTRDHTVVREDPFVPAGTRNSRHKYSITEALGLHNSPPVQVKKFALHERDLILMTTEGLTGRLSDMQILKVSLKTHGVKKLCGQLIYEARRIDRERSMTVGVIRLERKTPFRKKMLLAYSGIILCGLAVMVFFSTNPEPPTAHETTVVPQVTVPPKAAEKPKVPIVKGKKTVKPPPPQIAAPAPKAEVRTKAQVSNVEDELLKFTRDWKSAWEGSAGLKGDMGIYMSFYSKDFISGGLNKEAWKRDKERKNRKKRWIRIRLEDIRILKSSERDKAEVRFIQYYRSSNFSVRSRKKLTLGKDEKGWKILAETTN